MAAEQARDGANRPDDPMQGLEGLVRDFHYFPISQQVIRVRDMMAVHVALHVLASLLIHSLTHAI